MIAKNDDKPDWLTKNELQFTAIVIVFDQTQVSLQFVCIFEFYFDTNDNAHK